MSDIAALLRQMTLEEKAALITGASAWTTVAVDRLGIPGIFVADGPHGLRRNVDINAMSALGLPATCFPTASAVASTWNVDLIREMGQALGDEAKALKTDVLLGPGINMKRSPLCGRNFEYFSEDPCLAGEMAASFINGVQSRGVGASLKHFAANNQEYQRFRIDARIDERSLREIYLAAFEIAVKKGKPWTVMCAYNKVNGEYASEHHSLLVEILKDEWGFEGFVVSDWGAVHDRVKSLRAGLDLEMPGPRARRTQAVIEAVRSGALDEAILDESVRRILGVAFKAAGTPKGGEIDIPGHHALARRIAGEAIVLLKNDGLLPLRGVDAVAVIGRAAKEPYFQGGGSSHINPTRVDIPFDELQQALGPAARLSFAPGYPAGPDIQQALIDEAVQNARAAGVALLFLALPSYKESEGYDRADLDLTPQQVALIKAVTAAQPRTAVILNNSSALDMGDWIDGAAAVLEAWMMGQAGGGAIADVLTGRVTPSGKLAETFPLRLEDTPAYLHFPGGNGEVRYAEGLFIGYRYYDSKSLPVKFPFGHGLSYTTFGYANARASAGAIQDTDGLRVSVDITNTGAVAGREIVQVYVRDRQSALIRPAKELKAFAKVALEPGQTKTVSLDLDFRAFAYYHPGYGRWIAESGDFDILIGASSADIRQSLSVSLQSTLALPSLLDRASTLGEWLADSRGRAAIEPMLARFQAEVYATFGANANGVDPAGVSMTEFMNDMPIMSLLDFQENRLGINAEEIVDGLLAQVHGQ